MPSSMPLSAAFANLFLSTNQDSSTTINHSADVVEQHLPGHQELPFDQIAAFPGQDLKSFDLSQIVAEFAVADYNGAVPSSRGISRSSSPSSITPSTPLAEYREKHVIDNEAMSVLSSPDRLAQHHRGELGNSVPFSSQSVFFSPDVDAQRRNVKRLLGIYCDNRDRNDPRFDAVLEQIKGRDRFADFENVSRIIDNLGPFTIDKGQILKVIEYIIIGNWQRMNITTAFVLSSLPCERNLLDTRRTEAWATSTMPNMLSFQSQSTTALGGNPQHQVTSMQFPDSPRILPLNTSAPPQSARHMSSFMDKHHQQPVPPPPALLQQPFSPLRSPLALRPTLSQQPRSTHPEVAPEAMNKAHEVNAEGVRKPDDASVVEVNQPFTPIRAETQAEGPPNQSGLEPFTLQPVTGQPETQFKQTAQESQKPKMIESTPLTTLKHEPITPGSFTSTPAPTTSTSAPNASTSASFALISALSTPSNRAGALPKKFERLIGKDFRPNGQTVHFVWSVSQGPNKIDHPGKPAQNPPLAGDLFFHKVPVFNGDYLGSQVWLYSADKVWVDITETYFSVKLGEPLPHPTYSQYFLSLRDDQTPSYVKVESWKRNQKSQRAIRESLDNISTISGE